ncbi:MAG: NAD(P)H-binding protein, partial [Gemmatimonadetes bacterium]|nr:NAD(P)H-binding protein [Gemmatimonadota bacterium]NIR77598.1 NAD(P)H-binding protein [Gemmatimonadota bacterium]NIT86153.1 NAD(P)H-binding protein [Gemmatimonadota bacterium]NIU29967.1 NAD(P)H-binding protein [Gemmatimonadota bacterium]NIU34932.1 NAD(P)H-binding protein [Gemmatimonadota bacterium]
MSGDGEETPWLLYGAYGFTGRLIARRAIAMGLRPILAGRRREPTADLARELDLECRVFDLDDPPALREGLRGVQLVMHTAGPFSRTWRPMAEACLAAGVHYLDITGEIEVFEALAGLDGAARETGVMLLPGVGFDVVPTDCAAARVGGRLEEPVHLDLAFASSGGPSRGTALTMIEALGRPSRIRSGSRIVDVAWGSIARTIPFSDGERHGVCI